MTVDSTTTTIRLASQPGIKAGEAEALGLDLARDFVGLLDGLTPDEWRAVTPCDPWTVKDVAAHLVGWCDALCSPREMASQARAAFARRKQTGGLVDAQNDVQVERGRSMTPQEIVERLRVAMPKAARLRRRVGGALHYVPAYTSFLGGAINVGYLMNVIFLRDLLVHTFDVVDATGRSHTLTTSGARVVADMIRDWARRTGADATLELSGPGGGVFVAGTGTRASISSDAAAFARRLAGRRPATEITISGDERAAEAWIQKGCPV